MTLQQLRDLVAIVEHGGFRSAARALGVSQAGLTKSLSKFENEHGISLIERKTRGSTLTSVGQEFYHYAQSMLREAGRAEEWLHTTRSRPATDVSLGVSIEPSLRFVPAVLVDYRRILPQVTLRLTQSVAQELLSALRENRLEFAITRLPTRFDASDLIVDELCESESVIVARIGHPQARATSLDDLADEGWILLGNRALPTHHDDSILELFDASRGTTPKIAAVTDSLYGAISMLIESDCIARLPRAVLEHPMAGGLLTSIPLHDPPRRYRIALVRKASHRLSREAQTLAAMLSSFARITRAMPRKARTAEAAVIRVRSPRAT